MGHSSASFLSLLIAGRPEAPRPAPCRAKPDWEQLLPIQHPAQGILLSLVPMECDALPTTASPWTCASQALCSLSAARSWRWGLPNHLHPPSACYPIPGMLHPQGSDAAQRRGWRCCFLRSHLHVLPRRAWNGLSHHVQEVTGYGITLGKAIYDNSTVPALATPPCSFQEELRPGRTRQRRALGIHPGCPRAQSAAFVTPSPALAFLQAGKLQE